MGADKKMLNKKIGLLDVDSREVGQDGYGLVFRERVLPIADKLNRFYDFAYQYDLPLVFTTCCSGNFLKKDSSDYISYVPIDKADDSWIENIKNYRCFYIQKRQHGNPRINCENCAYDFFKYNANALKLFQSLGVKEWVVLGNGFDSCGRIACEHLLKNGFVPIIIEDAVVSDNGGNSESRKAIIDKLKEEGARVMIADEFFKKYGNGK